MREGIYSTAVYNEKADIVGRAEIYAVPIWLLIDDCVNTASESIQRNGGKGDEVVR